MKHWNELTELESAIYTLEGMIDDIDSTLYEKFQTVWDCVRDEGDDEEPEQDEFEFNFDGERHMDVNTYGTYTEYPSTTSYSYDPATSEEDEAFRDLEKALKNWRKVTP